MNTKRFIRLKSKHHTIMYEEVKGKIYTPSKSALGIPESNSCSFFKNVDLESRGLISIISEGIIMNVSSRTVSNAEI